MFSGGIVTGPALVAIFILAIAISAVTHYQISGKRFRSITAHWLHYRCGCEHATW